MKINSTMRVKPQDMDARAFLRDLLDAAVAAAEPGSALRRVLPPAHGRRAVVVGAGKASGEMARAFDHHWDGPVEGCVVVPTGTGGDGGRVRVLEATHPVPGLEGLHAAKQLMGLVSGLGADDHVVALMSGGGSALLPFPPPRFTLSDEIDLNRALLSSGAPISAMNAIRKHFSDIKGGRLAVAAHPAVVQSYVISDVPGDDPAQVASGPTIPDQADATIAMAYIDRYRLSLPTRILDHIKRDRAPDPRWEEFAQDVVHVVASARQSLEEASRVAGRAGIGSAILSDSIEGEAREVGQVLGAMVREIVLRDRPFHKPILLLSGGETTVTLRGAGRGGRNSEFLLALALEIDGLTGVAALAADTDGIDGIGKNAGAFADGSTAQSLRDAGCDPVALLHANDALTAFETVDGVVTTGTTGTNVNDFRAILIR